MKLKKIYYLELEEDTELVVGWDFEECVCAQRIDKDKIELFGTHAYKVFDDK